MLTVALGAAFTGCSDWTDPESVDVKYGTADTKAEYPAYLQSLRNYRGTDHKKVYAWVDIPAEGYTNQSHRLTSLPDSIDVVVIETPEAVSEFIAKEIKQVREDKGMEVIYCVDYDAMKADYKQLCEQLAAARAALEPGEDGTVTVPDSLLDPVFTDWILGKLTAKLKYAKSGNFTGLMFAFDGKTTSYLTDAERHEYQVEQRTFLGAASDWHKRNPEMSFDFLGIPQYIAGEAIANDFRVLFCRQGLDATNANVYSLVYSQAKAEGIPADRIGMMTTYTSTLEAEKNVGLFSDGSMAIVSIGKWAAANDVAAVGMMRVQNDYFFASFPYPYVRVAIQQINPSIK